jgi:hypothetical protein
MGDTVARTIAYLEIWGIGISYIGMAIATQRVAHRKGRSAETWLFYAALLPGVSLVHALLLNREKNA